MSFSLSIYLACAAILGALLFATLPGAAPPANSAPHARVVTSLP